MREIGSQTAMQPGEWRNIQTGLRSARAELPPEFAHLATDIDEFMRGALVDEGDQDIPTRRRAQLQYRAVLHRRVLQVDAAIELRGLFDKRGKLRVQWLATLQSLISTAMTLDHRLGLGRKAKRVPSLQEVMNSDE